METRSSEACASFVSDVIAKRWRPKFDPVWGEDMDSPLFNPVFRRHVASGYGSEAEQRHERL